MKHVCSVTTLVIILSFACKTNKDISFQNQQADTITPINLEMPEVIEDNKQLNIAITTDLSEGIILFDPMLVRIEKQHENSWQQVRILHCPCGAHCEPPPKWIKLSPEKPWSMKWNLSESWCENTSKGEIPETMERKADSGEYRVVIFYGYNEQDRIKLTKEFKIINY